MAYKRSSPNSIRILATIYRESLKTVPTPGVYLILDRSGTILYIGETDNINRRMNHFITNQQHHIWTNGAKKVQFERIESGQERRARKSTLIGLHNPKCNTGKSLASEFGHRPLTIDPRPAPPAFSKFYDQHDLDALERAEDLMAKVAKLALPAAPQLEGPLHAVRSSIDDAIRAEVDYKHALYEEYIKMVAGEEDRRIANGESPFRFKHSRDDLGGEEGCPYCGNPY